MTTRAPLRLVPHGDGQAVLIPHEVMEAAGLRPGDPLALTVRQDGVLEIQRASADEVALDDAFEWSLGHYGRTFEDLAR